MTESNEQNFVIEYLSALNKFQPHIIPPFEKELMPDPQEAFKRILEKIQQDNKK